MEELGPKKQIRFHAEYLRNRKSPSVLAILTLVSGWFGGHRFYLGGHRGLWYAAFFWTFIPGIIAFFEFGEMAERLEKYNLRLAKDPIRSNRTIAPRSLLDLLRKR